LFVIAQNVKFYWLQQKKKKNGRIYWLQQRT